MIGEISVLSNPAAVTEGMDSKGNKKKGRTVYLPPSFMEAQLLTGFDASTSGKGTNNPEPLLLRIQTPAVLPNDIKANLAGCFVIAEAVGRLDKERADVRLVSLSCLSNEGKAIIDTPVKGFVTDSDSKVGLSGRVVSRMGAAIARTIVAGFFGGMGDMLKSAATIQSTSALGTTTSVDSSQIAKYSIGGGLSEGAASLHDFYLSLAKQATPVIEVGAAKKITVIISEGKELEIREIEGDPF
ncbi:MAG: TraB/VirB10 family protein [Deltaproteobacteria bacterium]|nr:TraB/VirB10 family protein [Deltaproteobacteria bacterium]